MTYSSCSSLPIPPPERSPYGHLSGVLTFFILIFLLFPAIIPLFKPYVSGTADGLGHRFRLVSFYNSLKEGNIRPRWAQGVAIGYGAPIFLFNYPLPYYAASFFHFLGFSINTSGQLLGATSLLLSGFFMYLAVRRLIEGVEGGGGKGGLERSGRLGEWGGLVAAVVYTYAPYHLQMTYLYDSWGEITAFIFPPLILYLTMKMIRLCHSDQVPIQSGRVEESRSLSAYYLACARDPSTRPASRDSLGMTLTCHFFLLVFTWVLFILSHNVSAVMFSPILLGLALLLLTRFKIRPFLLVLNAFILAILISSFFWLPAFVLQNEMKYPQFLASEGAMRGSFFKSFSFQWETAFRVIKEGVTHYLDFTVGLPILLIGLIGLISLIWILKNGKKTSGYCLPAGQAGVTGLLTLLMLLMLLMLLILSLYLTTYSSNWLWNLPFISYLPAGQAGPLSFILYPFRFLFVANFAGALLAGILVGEIRERGVRWVIGVALIIFSLIQGLPYTRPAIDIFPFPEPYFYQRQTVTRAPATLKNMLIKEFLPVKADLSFLEEEESKSAREVIEIIEGKGKVEEIKNTSEKLESKISLESEAIIRINRFYFPNWKLMVDGSEEEVTPDEVGRIKLKMDKGKHDLKLIFGISDIEKIAYLISLGGIVIMIAIHHFRARA